MMRFPTVAVVLLIAEAGVVRCSSEEPGVTGADRAQAVETQAAERPMTVFNDKVRRFRFRIEDTLVTAETAQAFMLRHQGRNQPEIIGAYADSKTNSLVVVGPPEAEHAIRVTLATWIVERQGIFPRPLEAQRRTLEFRRKELLRDMASIEVHLVETEGSKAEQLQSRLQSFDDELRVVERQIQVMNRYIERSRDTASNTRASATP